MKYLIPLLAGALIMWLFLQTCNKEVQSENRTVKDSIVYKFDSVLLKNAKADSILAADSIKTLLSIINRTQDKADAKEQTMNEALAQSDFTNRKLSIALQAKDTTGVYKECAELNKQYEVSRSAGFAFKHERDSLLQLWPKVHTADSLALKGCYFYSARKTVLFDSLSAVYDKTDNQLTKALKSKVSIGLSAGYGIGKNGLTPIVGITVHYPLIKL